jgi:hypothetical protein
MQYKQFKELVEIKSLEELDILANSQLVINSFQLDEDLANQAVYTHLWESFLSDEKYKLKNIEQKKDEMYASLFVKYALPQDGSKKPSDEVIKQLVAEDTNIMILSRDYILQWHRVEKIKAICTAFERRTFMLKEECNLWIKNYYQDMSSSENTENIMDALNKKEKN